jgi:hypothetical protein
MTRRYQAATEQGVAITGSALTRLFVPCRVHRYRATTAAAAACDSSALDDYGLVGLTVSDQHKYSAPKQICNTDDDVVEFAARHYGLAVQL